MATKKYYAVKSGKVPGIFDNWDACKQSVDGFPKAEYKGFATLAEAKCYLGLEADVNTDDYVHKNIASDKHHYQMDSDKLLVYVDGSYNDAIKKYAFGCVFLLPNGEIRLAFGNGDNEQSLQHRNVTGEMLGAMYAVKTAMMNGYTSVELCYDYEGIEKWVTGAWKSKTELTIKYAQAMQEWSKSIQIKFTKVLAHSNVQYNELADETAKRGLTEGNGVPKVTKLEELALYGEANEI